MMLNRVVDVVCPRDHGALVARGARWLACAAGHEYPVVDGVPVLLIEEATPTIGLMRASLDLARRHAQGLPVSGWFEGSLGLNDRERQGVVDLGTRGGSPIDPAVAFLVGATNGIAYRHLTGQLAEYPIPALRLPPGSGRTLLDLGCSWGRWCLAAARLGYRPVGVDPSLGAILAARRVAATLGVDAQFIVADARALPFANGVVDTVFSYSVLQHFSSDDVARAVDEAARVLRPGGTSLIQMPTKWGLRCLYHQARRGFQEPTGFDVRYWTIPALRRLVGSRIGPTETSVDCFFGIGLQASDRRFMSPAQRVTTTLSEGLRAASSIVPPLTYAADSVYLTSTRNVAMERAS